MCGARVQSVPSHRGLRRLSRLPQFENISISGDITYSARALSMTRLARQERDKLGVSVNEHGDSMCNLKLLPSICFQGRSVQTNKMSGLSCSQKYSENEASECMDVSNRDS